mmetsp:Transcript_62159/g.175236  ORF Transcript_62159/g.175236 Transcript_62159/m.175236 type:complete len:215 (-) Transcript_62159:216-860(-)
MRSQSVCPPAVTAAPTTSLPSRSLDIKGNSLNFFRSPRVTNETSRPSSSRIGNFPTFARFSCSRASLMVIPCLAVVTSLTMTFDSSVCLFATASASRVLIKPTNFPLSWPFSVMGTPLTCCCARSWSKSLTVLSGPSVAGSVMKPLANRFTSATMAACACMLWSWWMTPTPPPSASAIAMPASVVVSMPTRGVRSMTFRVKRQPRSTSEGSKEV